MKRSLWRVLAAGGIALVVAIASTRFASAPRTAAAETPLSPSERREMDIAFYAERAARDTMGAADRARLSGLYLERGRESHSLEDFERAEAFARASVGLRESHNDGAYALLAATLMSQHRFAEAMTAARRADALAPGMASHAALIGEIAMELGDYDQARAMFDSLRGKQLSDAAILRLARWHEITGRIESAEARLSAVLVEWRGIPDVSPANLAWIQARMADLAFKAGRLEAADSIVTSGLSGAPMDKRLLTAGARTALARGDLSRAIKLAERASTETIALGVLSDAHAARGDALEAAAYAERMRTVAFSDGSGFPDRNWMLWMLDHDRSANEVLRYAKGELGERKDIYAWDVYAWALYKSGKATEARDAMKQALRMGTRDAVLQRHAAEIFGQR